MIPYNTKKRFMQGARKEKGLWRKRSKKQTRAHMRMCMTHFADWRKCWKHPPRTATAMSMKRFCNEENAGWWCPFIPRRVWWSWNKMCEYALPCMYSDYRVLLQPPRRVSMKRRGKDKDKSRKPLWAERIKAKQSRAQLIIHS